MDSIRLTAPSKINLSLRILGKRPDGFHELETFMVPITLSDEIEISHGSGEGIRFLCSDPDLPTGSDNLCVRAALAFLHATGLEHGVSISLLKRIPHGAGLGGGSSDAASVLKGLNEIFDTPLVEEELHQIAVTLGSDVSFFLGNGPAWCRGRGEILEPMDPLPHRRLLLIKPPFSVSTAWAYARYAAMSASETAPQIREEQQLGSFMIVNDLEQPVFEKYLLLPLLEDWLRKQDGVESAFMTGSGSTMVAIFEDSASEASIKKLQTDLPEHFGDTMKVISCGWL